MSKPKKLVFFDIDGTLLDHNKEIPRSAKEAIRELRSEGHEAAIATGRAPFLFKEIREELGIDTYVSLSGQYVVYRNEVVYANPISRQLLEQLTGDAVMNSQPILYLDELDMKMNVQQHARVDSSYEPLKIPVPGYDPGYYVERDIYQAIVFCTQEEEGVYLNKYANKLQFVRWGDHAVDVLPMGGSKAAGIARLIQKLGKKPEDAVAFGDHLNDLEMLQYVGHGVAMGNALPVVKKIASHVTTDVDRDGILHGLRHLGLIRAANVS